MAHHNSRYFTPSTASPLLIEIEKVVFGNLYVHPNLDNTKLVCKLPEGDTANHTCLSGVSEFTHEGITELLATPEWQPQTINDI